MEKQEKITIKTLLETIYKVFSFAFTIDKRRVSIIFFGTVILAVLVPLSAWYFSYFLNIAIYSTGASFFTHQIIATLGLLIGVKILQSILGLWMWRVQMTFNRIFFTETYLKITDASQRIDIQTYESSGFELLKARVDMYSNMYITYIDLVFEFISGLIPMIVSTIIIISLKKWWLLVFVMVPAIINFYVQIIDGQSLWECENKAGEERKKFRSFYSFFNTKAYIEEIKVHGLAKFLLTGIKDARNKINAIFSKRDTLYARKRLAADFITNILELVVPMVLIYQIFTKQLLVGTFYFLNGRFDAFTQNFRQTLRMLGNMYKNAPYVYDIQRYIDMQTVLKNGENKVDSFENLVVKNVTFTYPDSDRIILNSCDFSVTKGEKIAIIGLNGAGKTTLTKLLLRFYFPTQGEVLYNNMPIESLNKYSLYNQIGFLPQDFAKFDITFNEAITLGNIHTDIDEDRIIESAKKAEIHNFIMSHKDGYKTQIGKKYENGVELSGGQWQKLALARLFYRNAPLWILDEPTSAIDAEAEAKIFEQLEKLPDTITVIMISHRFSTVRNADRIIVIDKGTVREQGTHEELLKINGEYARLFSLQAEGYK